MPENQASYDSPWKEALELYFRSFLELCFPEIAADIDWTKSIDFLDKELEEVVRDAAVGKQWVDKLVRVYRLNGEEEWVLIHIEIQSQADYGLPKRVYQYHHRIEDRYGVKTATLVVLADERPGWRPGHYEQALWGCRVRFEFPICKLLDWYDRWGELEQSSNPIAVVILAHLKSQETKRAPDQRKEVRVRICKGLYQRGYGRDDIIALLRFIDGIMTLPRELAVAFWQEIREFEESMGTPYISSIERMGRDEGRQEGRVVTLREDILDNLEARFGVVSDEVRHKIESTEDESRLKELHRKAVVVSDLATFSQELP